MGRRRVLWPVRSLSLLRGRRLLIWILSWRIRFFLRRFGFVFLARFWSLCSALRLEKLEVLFFSLLFLLSSLIRSLHAEFLILNSKKITYLDSLSVLLTSFEISGSILILFSDSSKTLIAFMHSILLVLTSEG